MKKIKEIICPSSFTAQTIKRDKQFSKVTVTHLPTFQNNSYFKLSSRLFKKRFDKMQICFIGRVVEEKGVEVLVDAIKILEKKHNPFQFIIMGFSDTKYTQKIKKLILENSLQDRITCKDFLNKEEVFDIIKTSMYSVLPSICYDNMPNSLIESQSFGVPVIATDVGSFRELIQDSYNGWLFNYKDSLNLAQKILEVAKLPKNEYMRICENTITWVSDYCSKEKHIEKLEEIFSKYVAH